MLHLFLRMTGKALLRVRLSSDLASRHMSPPLHFVDARSLVIALEGSQTDLSTLSAFRGAESTRITGLASCLATLNLMPETEAICDGASITELEKQEPQTVFTRVHNVLSIMSEM